MRADGGSVLGMGHVTRCLALAAGLRELGVRSSFATASPAAVVRKIVAAGCDVVRVPRRSHWSEDARFFLRQAGRVRAAAAIVDSYQLGYSYQRMVRAAGIPLCVIEDVARGPIAADLAIDQRFGARASDHPAEGRTRFLLGPRYSLLRPAFATVRSRRRHRTGTPRVLIVMGGSDPRGATLRALDAIDALPLRFAVDVVAGVAYQRLSHLATAVKAARHPARLHCDPETVATLMGEAALAVSAAGGASWELACLGVPMLLLVAAGNQKPNAAGLARTGCALSLGSTSPFPARRLRDSVASLLADPRRLRRMSLAGSRVVDGMGARRAAEALLKLVK